LIYCERNFMAHQSGAERVAQHRARKRLAHEDFALCRGIG
jgi:hypothetical protein